jgi:hypothetical protein
MGKYSNGIIYGIRIYNFNDDDVSNTLFEEKYIEIMTQEQMRQAYLFYDLMLDKKDIYFKFYTECISTLDRENKKTMDWHPISLNQFLEFFNV